MVPGKCQPERLAAAEPQRHIAQHAADIVCLIETGAERLTLPRDGHSICAQANWGNRANRGQEGRRKVLLWSKEPWQPVDDAGHASLPPRRFVSGFIQTSVGEVTVIGVRIRGTRRRPGLSRLSINIR